MQIDAPVLPEYKRVLTPAALAFVETLCRAFEPRRQELLRRRAARQQEFDAGKLPDFPRESKALRDSDWKIADQPADPSIGAWRSPVPPTGRW
jgi:malate synthase